MHDARLADFCRSIRLLPLSALAVAGVALGAVSLRSGPMPSVGVESADEGELHDHMESMNAAMRFFNKTGASAENRAKALETIAKFQADVLASKLLTPGSAAKVPEAERLAFATDYRKMLAEVLATSCKLEVALLDGKYDEANRIAKEDLNKLKKTGHDKYEEEEEEKDEHRPPAGGKGK